MKGTYRGWLYRSSWCADMLYIASLGDLKAIQMNMLHSLIQEFMLHELELKNNTVKATKTICCVKGEM